MTSHESNSPTRTGYQSLARNVTLVVQILCILLTIVHAKIVSAAIFSCPSGDSVVFQDRPCTIKQNLEKKSTITHSSPLSIHTSWFELPEQAQDRAFCDKHGCECGQIEKSHQGSLAQSVADSLYLDGSWHRYKTSYEAWLESSSSSSESFELRKQMLEASCEIMISQTLLRNYADNILNILTTRVKIAEERGFDVKQPCLQGIEEACAYYDSVQLLSRIKTDAFSLRRVRGENKLPENEPLSSNDEP